MNEGVLPTRVGMFRGCPLRRARPLRSPHTRGDVPPRQVMSLLKPLFSPHAWGCSGTVFITERTFDVLPTRVGMFRLSKSLRAGAVRSPHTRGDVPFARSPCSLVVKFSPHAWGCSVFYHKVQGLRRVLPTRVGMFRRKPESKECRWRSPHTRGDVPVAERHFNLYAVFSPHAWGCSGLHALGKQGGPVLPTRVGMFRTRRLTKPHCLRSPHTRGDVPLAALEAKLAAAFSPHAWGCSERL